MAFEMLVGLKVTDSETYASYRKAMMPILVNYGGGFRYDFVVSEVLKSESEAPINRVFTIYFSSKENRDAFFSDPAYLKAKDEFFTRSVGATTIIAEYER